MLVVYAFSCIIQLYSGTSFSRNQQLVKDNIIILTPNLTCILQSAQSVQFEKWGHSVLIGTYIYDVNLPTL